MANEETGLVKTGLLATDTENIDSADLVEITALIQPHQAFALEILENAERQRLGKLFDKNKLIQEALDLLIEKHLIALHLNKQNLTKK